MCMKLTKNPFHIEHSFGRAVLTQWDEGAKPSCIRVEKNTSCEDQWKGMNPASLFSNSVTPSKLDEISECAFTWLREWNTSQGCFENSTHKRWHRLVSALPMTFLTNIILFITSGNNLFHIMPDCLPLTLTSPWPVTPWTPQCSAEQSGYWCFLLKCLYLPPPGNSRKKHPAGAKQVSESKPVVSKFSVLWIYKQAQ